MIPYLFILSVVVVFGLLTYRENFYDYKKIVYNFFIVALTLFAGLASSRGDMVQYTEAYAEGFGPTFEPAINIIGFLYKKLGLHIVFLFLTFAFIGLYLKFNFFFKATNELFFVSLISYVSAFYVSLEMGAIRFSVGTGFVLYNIYNIENKRFKPFILIALLGSIFHLSVLLTIPLYYLRWKVSLKKALLLLCSIAIVIGLIDFESFFDFLFETYFPEAIILVKFSTYFHEPAYITPVLIKRILFLLTICFFYKQLKEKQKWFNTLFLMYTLSVIVFFMFRQNHIAASRLSFLFATVEPVLFSSFILLTSNSKVKLLLISFISLYSYVNIVTMLNSQTDQYNLYLPYKLFFQQ